MGLLFPALGVAFRRSARASVLAGGLALTFGQLHPAAAAQDAARDVKLVRSNELPTPNKRWALIIGADAYADTQITPLRGAANDAAALARALTRYAGFPHDQIILLTTKQSPTRHPTRSNILFHLSNLSQLVPEDGLFAFFFAGHGVEREGQAFLLPSDARMTDNLRILDATGISFNNVRQWIEEMNVKQVLMFLDACRNNPTAGRGSEDNPLTETFTSEASFAERNSGIEAFAILYATAVGQRAYEYTEKQQGFFTWAIVEALKGGAANDAGEVTLGALEDYVQDVVPKRVALELGVERVQRPFAEVRGYRSDELVIADASLRALGEAGLGVTGEDDPAVAEADWEALADSRDPEEFRAFYRKHPDSPLAEQALDRLEALEWERLKVSDDVEALRAFYQARPHGPYADEALTRLRAFENKVADREEILDVLKSYREAFRKLDAEALRDVWPTLAQDRYDSLRRAFASARSFNVVLDIEGEPEVDGDRAKLRCRREIQFVSKEGRERSNSNDVTLKLRRRSDVWVIDDFEVH